MGTVPDCKDAKMAKTGNTKKKRIINFTTLSLGKTKDYVGNHP